MTGWDGICHILYVDDDDTARRTIQDAFAPECRIRTISSVSELEAVLDETIDCVVAAQSLPETSGIELAERFPEYPFVLVTDDRSGGLIRRAFRAGVDDVFYKSPVPEQVSVTAGEASKNGYSPYSETTIAALRDRIIELHSGYASDIRDVALDISRSLMGAAPDEIDIKIEWALESIGDEIDARRCVLYRRADDILDPTYDWCHSNVSSEDSPECLPVDRPIPTSEFPGYESGLDQFQAVHRIGQDDVPGTESPPSEEENPAAVAITDSMGGSEVTGDSTRTNISDESECDRSVLYLPIIVDWELTGVFAIEFEDVPEIDDATQRYLTTVGELVVHSSRRIRRQQELEEKNERLEEFASVLGHDIRSPLTVITGHIDLAQRTGEVDRLDAAKEAADRIGSLIDNMLALASDGAAVGEFEVVALGTVVDRAWSAIDTGDAAFERETLPTVQADPHRLQEAFENLFRNAVEHGSTSPHSNPRGDAVEHDSNNDRESVSVTVEATESGVAIEDDGPGIPPGERDKIFDRGYTGSGGTGLGLAIVASIVDGHGWEINVSDGSEGGARFEISMNQ